MLPAPRSAPVRMLPMLAATAIAAVTAFGDVRVVRQSPVATYPEIQDAIEASSDGDVVLVERGTYGSFNVRNKSITVIVDVGHEVHVTGPLRLFGTTPARTIFVSGLRSRGYSSNTWVTRTGAVVRHCHGPVRIQDCELDALSPMAIPCTPGEGLYTEDCADVIATHCEIVGSELGNVSGHGGPGVAAHSSTVALFDCWSRGGRGALDYGFCPPSGTNGVLGTGGPGASIEPTNVFFFAARTVFSGAQGLDGSCAMGGCQPAGDGGDGFVNATSGGTVWLHACRMLAGRAGRPDTTCGFGCQQAGASGTQLVGAATITQAPTLGLRATALAREGQTIALDLLGPPGETVTIWTTDRTTYRLQPSASGVLAADDPGPEPRLLLGRLSGSGVLHAEWKAPELGPGVESRVVWVQALSTAANGTRRMSEPRGVVIVDRSF